MKKRKTRAQRSRSFRCPHCGAAMILRPASEIYHDAKSDRKLYVCHNYPACNTYVAAHPNTDKPMGVPANGDLRNLRIQAHRKFDLIWKNGIMTREEAYRWFADSFGLSLRDAHIGMCSEYRCRELIRLCNEVLARNNCVAYYDDDDRVELAEEAKAEDYSLLLISMPKIEQDTEFTPDRLQSALQDNDRTEWVFSRLEEQWKQKYYAVAVSPPEHGTGNLCPISFGKYKGKYSARWIDCAHCHFNVAQPPCCLCVAGAGIQKKEDFKRDLQDRLFDIDKIRRTNEEEIRLREERDRSFERRSVYPRPTPYAARPVVPAGPTQEELDAEYIRICQSYDPTSDEWTVDRYNRRWIMCTVCGRIKQDAQMSYYGGKGGANRGVCADCSRNGRS